MEKSRGYVKIAQTCDLALETVSNGYGSILAALINSAVLSFQKVLSPETLGTPGEAHKTAISSMFEWYRRAQVCYVFLADAPSPKPGETLEEAFRNARWLTRGWALQEFLAPGCIKLFNSAWRKAEPSNFPSIFNHLESDDFELKLLHHFTTIDRHNWRAAGVPTRLSCAASRQTSRREDMTYCLLGFLDVKMPLLYGEATAAFSRLLEEVIKKSNSHGVLAAWYGLPSPSSLGGLLRESPRPYAGCRERFKHFSVGVAGAVMLISICQNRPRVLGNPFTSQLFYLRGQSFK